MQILLLEDDDGLRYTFARTLEKAGHDVTAVDNLEEAISALRRFRPDLMVLDFLIGNENSMQVVNYAQFFLPDVNVIFVTGSGMFPRGELFDMSENIRWVLRKPVNLNDLHTMVEHAAQ